MRIIGSLDRCDAEVVEGWLFLPDDPDEKLALEFVLEGQVIGHAVADRFREDLFAARLGDGCCAFSFRTPAFLPKSDLDRIEVRLLDSVVVLPRGPSARGTMEAVATPGPTVEIRYTGIDALKTSMANPARAWQGNKISARDRLLQNEYITPHHRPKFSISKTDKFFTIGSCFAREIEYKLAPLGVPLLLWNQGIGNCSRGWLRGVARGLGI